MNERDATWLRALAPGVFFGLGVDALLALAVSSVWDVGFLLAFLGLLALQAILWLKDSLVGWSTFVVTRRGMVDRVEQAMREARMPDPWRYVEPDEDQITAGEYFRSVKMDETLSFDTRADAAVTLHVLSVPWETADMGAMMRSTSVYDEAVSRYQRGFTRREQ